MGFRLNSKSVRRKQTPAIPWRLHLLVGFVGVIVIGIVTYGFYIGERLNSLDDPLLEAVMEIQSQAESADIWFREVIRGNLTADFKTIWQPLGQAVWYLQATVQDGRTVGRFFSPLEDKETRELISRIQQKLQTLEKITASTDGAANGPDSVARLRLQYEGAIADFLDQVGRLKNRLLNIKAKNLRHFRYLHLVLIVTCVALFFAIAFAFQFFVRRKTKDYLALQQAKLKLEIENAERLKAETELKNTHQGLEKRVLQRTVELSRTNERLRAENDERRRVENQLQQSKSMLQDIFDGIPDSLILVDNHMNLKMINKSATVFYRVERPEDIIGKQCIQATCGSTSCEGCRIPEAVRNGHEIMFERKGFMSPDRIEQVTVYPLNSAKGAVRNAIIRVNDITKARLFERQLIQSEKMASLGILVPSIAHEINNPNSFISFNIPILRDYIEAILPIVDRFAPTDPAQEFCRMPYKAFRKDIFRLMDNVENGAERISSFVANLREFARRDGDQLRKYVDFKSVIEKVLAICGKELKKSVKSVELNVPSDLPEIHTAPYAMEQILINLLMNAAQAADKENSYVKLVVSLGSTWREHLIIDVIDNGCGIDEKSKDRLFDPFYTTKLPGDGTGLGLYVCHNLIQGMGGRIEVQSEAGTGSRFTVVLPNKDNRKKQR